jgi:hypothetical protein
MDDDVELCNIGSSRRAGSSTGDELPPVFLTEIYQPQMATARNGAI